MIRQQIALEGVESESMVDRDTKDSTTKTNDVTKTSYDASVTTVVMPTNLTMNEPAPASNGGSGDTPGSVHETPVESREPSIASPPSVLLSTSASVGAMSNSIPTTRTHTISTVDAYVMTPEEAHNVPEVTPSRSANSGRSSVVSSRTNMIVHITLFTLVFTTIVTYVVVWQVNESQYVWVHVVFLFILISLILVWERWRYAQRLLGPRDNGRRSTSLGNRRRLRPDNTGRLWAPWDDPELQARIFHRLGTARPNANADAFDPELSPDYLPPPAYGNVRGSVLIDPITGLPVDVNGDNEANSETHIASPPPVLTNNNLPDYDSISVRSRTSVPPENAVRDVSQPEMTEIAITIEGDDSRSVRSSLSSLPPPHMFARNDLSSLSSTSGSNRNSQISRQTSTSTLQQSLLPS